jgi:hypothetical protein
MVLLNRATPSSYSCNFTVYDFFKKSNKKRSNQYNELILLKGKLFILIKQEEKYETQSSVH